MTLWAREFRRLISCFKLTQSRITTHSLTFTTSFYPHNSLCKTCTMNSMTFFHYICLITVINYSTNISQDIITQAGIFANVLLSMSAAKATVGILILRLSFPIHLKTPSQYNLITVKEKVRQLLPMLDLLGKNVALQFNL